MKKCCSSSGGTWVEQSGNIASVKSDKYFNEVIIFEPYSNFNLLYLLLNLIESRIMIWFDWETAILYSIKEISLKVKNVLAISNEKYELLCLKADLGRSKFCSNIQKWPSIHFIICTVKHVALGLPTSKWVREACTEQHHITIINIPQNPALPVMPWQ